MIGAVAPDAHKWKHRDYVIPKDFEFDLKIKNKGGRIRPQPLQWPGLEEKHSYSDEEDEEEYYAFQQLGRLPPQRSKWYAPAPLLPATFPTPWADQMRKQVSIDYGHGKTVALTTKPLSIDYGHKKKPFRQDEYPECEPPPSRRGFSNSPIPLERLRPRIPEREFYEREYMSRPDERWRREPPLPLQREAVRSIPEYRRRWEDEYYDRPRIPGWPSRSSESLDRSWTAERDPLAIPRLPERYPLAIPRLPERDPPVRPEEPLARTGFLESEALKRPVLPEVEPDTVAIPGLQDKDPRQDIIEKDPPTKLEYPQTELPARTGSSEREPVAKPGFPDKKLRTEPILWNPEPPGLPKPLPPEHKQPDPEKSKPLIIDYSHALSKADASPHFSEPPKPDFLEAFPLDITTPKPSKRGITESTDYAQHGAPKQPKIDDDRYFIFLIHSSQSLIIAKFTIQVSALIPYGYE